MRFLVTNLHSTVAAFEEAERDAQLAARDPRNLLSPNALSPGGNDVDENPFESEFNEYYDDDDVDEDGDVKMHPFDAYIATPGARREVFH